MKQLIINSNTDLSQFNAFLAVDLETTGLNPVMDSIIEYGSYRVEPNILPVELDILINPGIPVPEFIRNLTGITDNDLIGQPSESEVIDRIVKDLTVPNTLVMAHNAQFDFGFLRHALRRNGIDIDELGFTYTCTRNFSRFMNSIGKFDNKGSNRLEDLMAVIGIEDPNHHRSVNDCIMCYNLFKKLKELHSLN